MGGIRGKPNRVAGACLSFGIAGDEVIRRVGPGAASTTITTGRPIRSSPNGAARGDRGRGRSEGGAAGAFGIAEAASDEPKSPHANASTIVKNLGRFFMSAFLFSSRRDMIRIDRWHRAWAAMGLGEIAKECRKAERERKVVWEDGLTGRFRRDGHRRVLEAWVRHHLERRCGFVCGRALL